MRPRSAGGCCRACSRARLCWPPRPARPETSPRAAPAASRDDARRRTQAAAEPLKNEIPPDELDAVMAAHFKGLGLMEQYEYRKAAEAFREVHERAPGWIPGSINLAIALLNDSGVQAEAAKKAGRRRRAEQLRRGPAAPGGRPRARPGQPPRPLLPGHHPRAAGGPRRGPQALQGVTELDPNDATAWYWIGEHAHRPRRPDSARRAPSRPRSRSRSTPRRSSCDPYLTPAIYKLSFAYRLAGEPDKQKELLDRWREINPDRQKPVPGPGRTRPTRSTARWAGTPR